jgi:hypothetical protein
VFLAPGVQGFGYQVLGAVKMAGLDFNNPLNDERASWLRGPGQSAGERTDQQPQQQAFRRRSLSADRGFSTGRIARPRWKH